MTRMTVTVFGSLCTGDRVQVFLPYFGFLYACVDSFENGNAVLTYALKYFEEENMDYALGCVHVLCDSNRRRLMPFTGKPDRRLTPRFDFSVETVLRRQDASDEANYVEIDCEIRKISIRAIEIKCTENINVGDDVILCGRAMRVKKKRFAHLTLESMH